METAASGIAIIKAAAVQDVFTEVIVLTAHGNVPNAVECLKRGAFDYVEKNIPGEKPVRIGWFGWNLRIIREAVVLPKRFPQTLKDSPKLPSEKYKQDLYDKLLQWWQQNKDKLEWSNEAGKLDLKVD